MLTPVSGAYISSKPCKTSLSPLKSKKYESLFENIDLVQPVMEYPTVVSGSVAQASWDSDALAPINTPVFEPFTDSGLTPANKLNVQMKSF